jgi:hypothetical protein
MGRFAKLLGRPAAGLALLCPLTTGLSFMRSVACLSLVLGAIACSAETATSPTLPIVARESLALRLQTAHFQMFASTTTPDAMLRAAADRLEMEYPRILSDLGVSSHPTVTVRIWQDPTAYYGEQTRFFGTSYQATGYIAGPTELRLLAGGNLNTNVVHEFAHAVSLNMNPRFANNPRWFWETVALYENREFVHPQLIESVSRGTFPTLQQLNADANTDTPIYQLGYLLGEFIVSRYGRDAFIKLVQTSADLQGVLGVSNAEFEAAWRSFVRQKYLS